VVLVTGNQDRANAVKAIGLGAYDFYQKPFDPEILGLVVSRAFRLHALQQENRQLQQSQDTAMHGIITRDSGMLKICRSVEKVAPSQASVLLLGESGTGKELLARAVHQLSPRTAKRFVAINCAAIPENLLESELFGYEKVRLPAPTSRPAARSSLPTAARFFLDEVGDLSLPLQAKCCVFSRSGWSSASVGVKRSPWMCASCARPSEPEETDRRRAFPRGPLLPLERNHHQHPAIA
jgi:two-component system NtrC family response regulator